MSQADPPAARLDPDPSMRHRNRGSRSIVVVLAAVAVFATLIYLLAAPARRQLTAFAHPDAPAAVPSVSASSAPAAIDDNRLIALATDLAQLRARVETLEHRTPLAVPAASSSDPGSDLMTTALSARMDALATQFASQASQLRADEFRLESATAQIATLSAATDRASRTARIQAAGAALAAGLPLGDLPGASPALARFRIDPPPTETQLRLTFPAAAAAATAASRPDTAQLGFWPALRLRMQSLITIRRGDTLIVGSGQIAAIDRARTALELGDLAGCVALLDTLTGPAATAVAPWLGRARALLDARAALVHLAGQG